MAMWRRRVLVGAFALGAASWAMANDPDWWDVDPNDDSDNVIDPSAQQSNNYGPGNLGQLKWMAHRAHEVMQDRLPGGAGFDLDALFPPMPTVEPGATQAREANLAPVDLGQVKAVAKPFYDRLLGLGFDTRNSIAQSHSPALWWHYYPWDPSTPASANHLMVNVGQLKVVWGFDFGEVDAMLMTELSPVRWTGETQCVATYPGPQGSVLTKNAPNNWDAEGLSERRMYRSGGVRFKIEQLDRALMMGLAETNVNASYHVRYAIYRYVGDVYVYENGIFVGHYGDATDFPADTEFEVRRIGSTVYYLADGAVLETSGIASNAPLMVDTAIYNNGGQFTDCLCWGFYALDGDLDGDGMSNGWETDKGLDPNASSDGDADPDGDGFTNLEEFYADTDPNDVNDKPLIAGSSTVLHTPLEP